MKEMKSTNLGTGTLVIAHRTSDKIIVGADSLQVFPDEPDDKRHKFICKIGLCNNIAYSTTGISVYPVMEYDAMDYCKKVIQRCKTIKESMDTIEAEFPEIYKAVLVAIDADTKEEDRESVRNTMTFIILCGIEDGQTVISSCLFYADWDNTAPMFHHHRDNNKPADQSYGFGLQHPSYKHQMQAWNRLPKLENEIATTIRSDIQGEIDYQKEMFDFNDIIVGGTISILLMDSTGSKWLLNESGCPDT